MGNSKKWITVKHGLTSILITSIALLAAACSQEATTTPGPGGQVFPTVHSSTGVLPNSSTDLVGSPTALAETLFPQSTSSETSTLSAATPTAPGASATEVQSVPNATAFPDVKQFNWVPVVNGLDGPVGLANAGDGSGRLFALERAGRIRLIQGGQLQPMPYLDITDRVGSRGTEQGLLGIAFDPKFRENGFFYVNYTDLHGDTMIARFHAEPSGSQADPSSQQEILSVRQPYANHNGGGMLFGPDGDLYLGLGDGGSAGDPNGNGQSLDTLLGKIMRIDVSGTQPYVTPMDNPFVNNGRPEIWAYGLRNPWRFDIDPLTHDMYIADVGQNQWEEIDYLPAGSPPGANFGWNFREGQHDFRGNPPADLKLIEPVYEYSHSNGCSVTGGVVYRGQALPAWQGIYLFADYCSGKIWGLMRDTSGAWQGQVIYETNYAITSFGRDEQGEVYLVDQNGAILKLANAS